MRLSVTLPLRAVCGPVLFFLPKSHLLLAVGDIGELTISDDGRVGSVTCFTTSVSPRVVGGGATNNLRWWSQESDLNWHRKSASLLSTCDYSQKHVACNDAFSGSNLVPEPPSFVCFLGETMVAFNTMFYFLVIFLLLQRVSNLLVHSNKNGKIC